MGPPAEAPPRVRRRRVLSRFERLVEIEERRLVGSPAKDLRRTIVERFVSRNLKGVRGKVLEVGPGTGRFTPLLGAPGRKVLLLDLSPQMLRAARRRGRRLPATHRPWGYVRGAAEGLRMLRPSSVDAVVLIGVFGFFGRDVDELLKGVHRVLRPGGRFLLEAVSPTGVVTEFFPALPETAERILRAPDSHHLWRVMHEGYQPYDPTHLALWEFGFWRPTKLAPRLERRGFRIVERMSVAPLFGNHPALLRRLKRNPAAWRTALLLEEEAGHFDEMLGGGPVWLVAAVRTRKSRPSHRSAAGQ